MKALKLLEDDEEPNRKRWRTYDANLPFESGSRSPLGPQFVGAVTGTDQEASPQGTHVSRRTLVGGSPITKKWALAGVAPWTEHQPVDRRAAGSSPGLSKNK